MTGNRLCLDDRNHAVSAPEREETYFYKSIEKFQKYHHALPLPILPYIKPATPATIIT